MLHRYIPLQTLPTRVSSRARFTLVKALDGGVLLRGEHGFWKFIERCVGSIGADDAFAFPVRVLPVSTGGVASTAVAASVSKFFAVDDGQYLERRVR
jgi:hypothetical protein